MRKLLLVGLLVLTPQLALAQVDKPNMGMKLLQECKALDNDDSSWSNGVNYGYCLGVLKTWLDAAYFGHFDTVTACFPDGVDAHQLRIVFIKYAEKHPERLHEMYYTLLKDSSGEAWPC